MAAVIDTDKGAVLGRWQCENADCGGAVVVRSDSRWSSPPRGASERCSCRFCCFSPADRAGTMVWIPAGSNVIPFRR